MRVAEHTYHSMSMAAVSGRHGPRPASGALRRLLWAGPLAVAAAVATTLAAWAVVVALLPPINPAFVELAAASVALVTSVLCTASVAVFTLILWRSARPHHTFRVVAVVALVLSWLPDLMLLSEPAATVGGVVALMVLHLVAAVTVCCTLTAFTSTD